MKVGIVGPQNYIDGIRSGIHYEDAFIECIEYPCGRKMACQIVEEIQKDVDGILFTGRRYFDYVSQRVTAIIPWTYLKSSKASLLCLLLEAELSGRDITRITYDIKDMEAEKMLNILCNEVGLDEKKISLFSYCDTKEYRDQIYSERISWFVDSACKYHTDNLQSGRADACLTDSYTVASRMKEKGYPVFLMKRTDEDITTALNDLRLRYQLYEQQKGDNHQEGVLLLETHLQEGKDVWQQEYLRIKSAYQVETTIQTFAQGISASVEKQTDLRYLVYSTKGEIEVSTDHFTRHELANNLLAIPGVERLSMGFGFDLSHGAAKASAQRAFKAALQQKYSCYYIQGRDALMQGPFLYTSGGTEKHFDEIMLERISLSSRVGTTVLNTIIRAQRQYGFQTVTSAELAKMTGMSLNNVHRIIAKLEESGYAEIVGNRSSGGHGRPNRLIHFTFPLSVN